MDSRSHWENVYETKKADQVSWFKPHLSKSLGLILEAGIKKNDPVIDVGGGASTLADDLLREGFTDITVLDISSQSLEVTKKRLGKESSKIHWLVDDITTANLPKGRYALWHDRAVFHFLTKSEDRKKYVTIMNQSLKPQGTAIIATFSLKGPERCSGLDIVRYSAETLQAELGKNYHRMKSLEESHDTPFGTKQEFIYCVFKRQMGEKL